jgi:hypothetical protein
MTKQTAAVPGGPGDWVEAHMIGGGPVRRGMILEVLGRPGHEHYRVRWDEDHESVFFPADGVSIVRGAPHASRGASPDYADRPLKPGREQATPRRPAR